MSINTVSISGFLTRDADLRTTPSGTYVLNLGVAVNERRKNQQGEWVDSPQFIDCTMFGTRAEKVAPYLTKGTKVAIHGHLHYSSWEDKQGNKRSKLDVTIDDIEFMSRGEKREQHYHSDDPYSMPMMPQNEAYSDDPIPF